MKLCIGCLLRFVVGSCLRLGGLVIGVYFVWEIVLVCDVGVCFGFVLLSLLLVMRLLMCFCWLILLWCFSI